MKKSTSKKEAAPKKYRLIVDEPMLEIIKEAILVAYLYKGKQWLKEYNFTQQLLARTLYLLDSLPKEVKND